MSFEKVDLISRRWIITISNPLEKGYTHKKIKDILSNIRLDYWCMSDELCDGVYYTILFVYRLRGIRRSFISAYFPDTNLYRLTQGCCKRIRMYVWKEGIYKKRFPNIVSYRRTREQWHSKGTNLQCILHNTER